MLYDWFQHMEFAYIWVLPLLGILPVLAWMHFRTLQSKRAAIAITTAAPFKHNTFKNTFVHAPFVVRLLAIGCIITAMARPQVKNETTQTTGEGVDIVLCMDVSGSMLSSDFKPNRLEVAKEVAVDFVRSRPVDPIGLVIFSGESYTRFPVSTNHNMLIEQIQSLRSGILEDGTLIGEGLATSVDRLTAGRSKSKVVILLTDGKEQPPKTRLIDPITALEIAKAKGVRVYTIGMNAIPSATVQEKGAGNVGNNGGLDEGLLKRIAGETGGEYFKATDKEGLQKIYNRIDRLEKYKVDIITRQRVQEKFFPFLLAALILIGVEIILRYIFLRTFP